MFARIFRFVLVAVCIQCFFAQPAPAFDAELASRLQSALNAGIDELKIPGAVMIIDGYGYGRWTGTAGISQYSPDTPMTSDLSFHIGSVTKTMTATIILQLVEEGRFTLDTTLDRFFPGMVPNTGIITIRHLLEMQSGLGNYSFSEEFGMQAEADPLRNWRPVELIRYSNSTYALPGTKYDYNNANYILLGMIIERVTGKTFETVLRERIAAPLGLSRTYAPSSAAMPAPYAHGYSYENGAVTDNSEAVSPSLAWAAGSVISTAGEMLEWLHALLDGTMLSGDMQQERMTIPVDGEGFGYGLGLARVKNGIGHTGIYNDFYTALALRYKGWFISILCNGQAAGGGAHSTAFSLFQYIDTTAGFPSVPAGNFTDGGQGCMMSPHAGFSMEFLLLGLFAVPLLILRRLR